MDILLLDSKTLKSSTSFVQILINESIFNPFLYKKRQRVSHKIFTVILGFRHLFFQTTPPAWQQSKSRKKNEFVKANDKEMYNPPPPQIWKER